MFQSYFIFPVGVSLTIAVMGLMMLSYLVPVDPSIGPSKTQLIIFIINFVFIVLMFCWLFWRLCCKPVGTVPYIHFKNVPDEQIENTVRRTLLV